MWESVVPGALGTMTDVTFTITNQTHESRYHNQLGLLFVKADGSFDVGSVHPTDANYTSAALHDSSVQSVFAQNAQAGITQTYSLPAGKLVDFFFVQDDTIEDYLNNAVSTGPDSWVAHESPGDSHHPVSTSPLRPNVFFLNAAANSDGYAHFRTSPQTDGSQLYEVEDIAGGGDQDFNDLVFSVAAINPDHAPQFDTTPPAAFSPTTFTTKPSTITLDATIRDFHPHFPSDFQHLEYYVPGVVTGLVDSELDPVTGLPVPSSDVAKLNSGWIESAATFNDWYTDQPGINLRTVSPIVFQLDANGNYVFDARANNAPGFFPINDRLFGNENPSGQTSVNGNFTAEIHTTFTYHSGEKFSFAGDDDLWVFVNKHLAIDLGGVHGVGYGTINMDTLASQLGLQLNTTYQFDMFYAERFLGGSNFYASTNIALGRNYTYTYPSHAADPDAGDQANLIYSLTAPTDATIDPHTGEVNWIPPQSGTYHFAIKVADPEGGSDTQAWDVNVTGVDPDHAPQLVAGHPLPSATPSVGRAYEQTVDRNFYDPDGDRLTFTSSNLPAWLTLDPDGVLHGTPAASDITGPRTLTIVAHDGRGRTAGLDVPIAVDYYAPGQPVIASLQVWNGVTPIIQWAQNPENDVIGYNIFKLNAVGGWDLLERPDHSTLIPRVLGQTAQYTDPTPRVGYPNKYRIVAISSIDGQTRTSDPIVGSIVVKDATTPHVPASVSLATSGNDATLTWDSSDREPDVEQYFVYASDDAQTTWKVPTAVIPATAAATWTDTGGITAGHLYYAVRAVDYSGNQSAAVTPGQRDNATFTASRQSVNEHSPVTVAFANAPAGASFSYDFNDDGVYDASFGEIQDTTSASVIVPASYLDDGNHTYSLAAYILADGVSTKYTTEITVTNVAPAVTIENIPTDLVVGTAVTLTASASDPSLTDTANGFIFHWTITLNGQSFATATGSSVTFTPTETGGFGAQVQVVDKDGGSTETAVETVPTLEDFAGVVNAVSDDPADLPSLEFPSLDSPADYTFHRTTAPLDQAETIYFGFDSKYELNEADPSLDFEGYDTVPGYTRVFSYTIPAGEMSATMSLTPTTDDFNEQHKGVYLNILGVGTIHSIAGRGALRIKQVDGAEHQAVSTAAGLLQELHTAIDTNNKISVMTITGHGDVGLMELNDDDLLTWANGSIYLNSQDITSLMRAAMAPSGAIYLQGCHTGGDNYWFSSGDNNIAKNFSIILPGVTVSGGKRFLARVGQNTVVGNQRYYLNGVVINN